MTSSSLQHAIDNIEWYHDFDFGNGLRATSRMENVDAIRPIWRFIEQQLDRIDFRGKSVLEVGAWDGYWSFYAERRGATRVVATDDLSQNWAAGAGIVLAKELYGSQIEIRQDVSVYDLASVGETFDIILCLGVFYHLHDPLYAFTQLRHRCHPESFVVVEGALGCSGMRHNEVRYFYKPWLEFLPSSSALNALLKASYFNVESQTWMTSSSTTSEDADLDTDRALFVCVPFSGINDVFTYKPLLELHNYDPRFSQGLRAELEIVDLTPAAEAGEQFVARILVRNEGSCNWTALPAPDGYGSMFRDEEAGSGNGEATRIARYRHYIESNGLQGMMTVGVHLSSDLGGGIIEHDYARGFFPSDVCLGRRAR